MRVNAKLLLKVGISLGLLAFFLHSSGIDKTLQELARANLWYIPLGVIIYLVSQWVSSYRWKFLCEPLGFRLSLREFYDYYLMGMFFSLFLPGAIGGDVSRMVYLAKSQSRRKREALLTLLAERGVGMVALVLLTSVMCLLPTGKLIPLWIRLTMWGMTGVGMVLFTTLQVIPVQKWVERFPWLSLITQAEAYWRDIPLLARSVGISLAVHASMVGIHVLILQALGLQMPFPYLVAVYGIVGIASVLPISFNGLGVREGAYVFLLGRVGIPSHEGLAFGLYWFLISACTSLVGGWVFLKGHYKTPTPEDVEEEASSMTYCTSV